MGRGLIDTLGTTFSDGINSVNIMEILSPNHFV